MSEQSSMAEQKDTAPSEQGGDINDTSLDCDITPTADDLANWDKLQTEARAGAKTWKERVAKYHLANGSETPLPKDAYMHHPAYKNIAAMLSCIFIIATQDEVDLWAMETLERITRNENGDILYADKGQEGIEAQIDYSRRSARIAATNGDIGNAGLADQNVELGEYLRVLLWGAGEIKQLPLAIAIREAV